MEPEGEGYPDFLANLVLSIECTEQVVFAIKEILSKLLGPQPVAEEQDKMVVAANSGGKDIAQGKGKKGKKRPT